MKTMLLAISETDLKAYQTACQLQNVEVLKTTKTDGMFGVEYELVLKANTPEQWFKLGIEVMKIKYEL